MFFEEFPWVKKSFSLEESLTLRVVMLVGKSPKYFDFNSDIPSLTSGAN
jgi:hypothetical protein